MELEEIVLKLVGDTSFLYNNEEHNKKALENTNTLIKLTEHLITILIGIHRDYLVDEACTESFEQAKSNIEELRKRIILTLLEMK